MSADLLRQAATLMRERAKLADSIDRAPWSYEPVISDYDDAKVMAAPSDGWAVVEDIAHQTASHIASWHPGVALAVADWLDEAADFFVHYRGYTHALDNPLAVARTYLGVDR